MKRINHYIAGAVLISACSFGISSCSLDEYNPSGEGADAVFVTEQGMENLVNQLYYNFKWKYFGREDPTLYFEGAGDIWANIATNYGYGKQMSRFIDLQGDRGQIANAWNRVYDNVNIANAVINRVDKVQGISTSMRNDFEGEARFMRAYCYWWLVEFFGDIEMRLEETSSPSYSAVRTDRKTIYDQVIIPDAEKATQLLPVAPLNGDVGRATKKAAYGILARACLARAQYEEAGSAAQQAFYQKAYDAANYVMQNKSELGIRLYATYDEIWQAKNNKSNTEFLWVVTHSSITSLNPNPNNPNRLHMYWSPKLIDRAGITNTATSWEYPKESGYALAPTYYFLKLWQDWDARYDAIFQEDFPENNARGSYRWSQVMADNYLAPASIVGKTVQAGQTILRFTRKNVTDAEKEAAAQQGILLLGLDDYFHTEALTSLGGCRMRQPEESSNYLASSFPRFMKYRIWDRDANGTILLAAANGNVGFADVPVMRYAEMPLIAAEAQIGLGNPNAAAEIINREIRNSRVVKSGHSLSEAQVTANDMTVEWILEERARELCGEWLRWFDLKRTGKLVSYIRGHNPAMDGIDVVDEHNNLWPIPNTYLDKLQNAEEFGQNPGYNPYVRK